MISELGRRGLKLVLWQAPVVKRISDCPEAARERQQKALDEASDGGYLVRRSDGTPYTIPDGKWFGGSPIPDFTSPAACRWWFEKRRYLLDQGVAGFKTDGGEFIHDDTLSFADGSRGAAMRSGYAARYLEAFGRFIGPDRVLFSRAGWAGSQRWSLHWAGDQKSQWSELAAQLSAGLSAGLSGIPFWGFDIGGFAGPLPDAELYLRAFELAVFSPLLQWHSEPPYGQFAQIMPAPGGNNDRSPWNISSATEDERVIPLCRNLSRLRMALIPYLHEQFRTAAETGLPVMRHLFIEAPEDPAAGQIHDQFLLGPDLLVAPVITAGTVTRKVSFPPGSWIDVWDGRAYEGGEGCEVSAPLGRCAVFRRSGTQISLDTHWVDESTPPYLSHFSGEG
jgi:alpha-D-xyloside xylohydrolase